MNGFNDALQEHKKGIYNILDMAMEITIGRLVLALPKKDLEKINEMLKKAFGDKKNNE